MYGKLPVLLFLYSFFCFQTELKLFIYFENYFRNHLRLHISKTGKIDLGISLSMLDEERT